MTLRSSLSGVPVGDENPADFEVYSRAICGGKYRVMVGIPPVGTVPDEDADEVAREVATALREIADGFDKQAPMPPRWKA
jgi:hypothetical protein